MIKKNEVLLNPFLGDPLVFATQGKSRVVCLYKSKMKKLLIIADMKFEEKT